MFTDINVWEVLVATIVCFAVGAIWYGPLFGKYWMGLMGFTPENMGTMKLSPTQAMSMGFVSTLVFVYVLNLFSGVWHAVGVNGAFSLAFFVWLGFFVPTLFGAFLWENRPLKLFFFNAFYQFVSIFVTALVLVLWV